jgi:hypothetical protein
MMQRQVRSVIPLFVVGFMVLRRLGQAALV